MQSAISSSPTAEIMTSGMYLIQVNGEINNFKPTNSHLKTKLKFPTISSRTYSGKYLKASGCSSGKGNLEIISIL